MKKILLVNAIILAVIVVLIEGGARIAGFAPEQFHYYGAVPPGPGYPRYYHEAHPERGFDIAPNQGQRIFNFGDTQVAIWSNKYGCFDHRADYPEDYILLIGDSAGWGYAPYQDKWGTRLEQLIDYPVAKCAVTATGQRHQLSHAKDIVKKIGHAPKAVILIHNHNDLFDDQYYPTITVKDGYVVNTVNIHTGVRMTPDEMDAAFNRWKAEYLDLRQLSLQNLLSPRFYLRWLRDHTILMNAVLIAHKSLTTPQRSDDSGVHTEADILRLNSATPEGEVVNRKAQLAIRDWTQEIGASFGVLLFPHRYLNVPQYTSAKAFYEANDIPYVDPVPALKAYQDETGEFVYWPTDGHWNSAGNIVAAKALAPMVKDLLAQQK